MYQKVNFGQSKQVLRKMIRPRFLLALRQSTQAAKERTADRTEECTGPYSVVRSAMRGQDCTDREWKVSRKTLS